MRLFEAELLEKFVRQIGSLSPAASGKLRVIGAPRLARASMG